MMQKIIAAIGDIHGRSEWQSILQKGYDKVIFIGDYFDTHENIHGDEQLTNFIEILHYREVDSSIELLLGNHDFQYLRGIKERYTGFQPDYYPQIQEVLHSALDNKYLKVCHQEGNIIFSHAGITTTWAEVLHDPPDLAMAMNQLFETKPEAFGFTPCAKDKYSENVDPRGDEICQSPLWVRPGSLLRDKLKGYSQVVGHTPQSKLRIEDGIAFIDCLATSGEYLILRDGDFQVGSLT